jgi:hypothetical protein
VSLSSASANCHEFFNFLMIFFLNSKLGAPEIREPRKEERSAAAEQQSFLY